MKSINDREMNKELINLLNEEYDTVVQESVDTFKCYIELLDETHYVTIIGDLLQAFNPTTNHKWLLN